MLGGDETNPTFGERQVYRMKLKKQKFSIIFRI